MTHRLALSALRHTARAAYDLTKGLLAPAVAFGLLWMGTAEAQQPTALAVVSVTGPAGGAVTISATLTTNGVPVQGETISFVTAGGPWDDGSGFSAVTDASGVASGTMTIPPTAAPRAYPGSMMATFFRNVAYSPSSASGDVTVTCGTVTAVASGSATIVVGQSTPLSGTGGLSCSWSP
ncbi:MAG TPA: hypothetical protein VJA66_16340, partial [Thermoanaerobaculia bacterium]